MKVRYIGLKDLKTDNVAGTGAVWMGFGDVQEVPDEAWPKLARHPEVWQDASKKAPEKPSTSKPEHKYELLGANDEPIVLDTMTLTQLKAFAKKHQLEFDPEQKDVEKLRAHLFAEATKD